MTGGFYTSLGAPPWGGPGRPLGSSTPGVFPGQKTDRHGKKSLRTQGRWTNKRGQCGVGTGPGVPHVTSVLLRAPYILEGALGLINY